ncbi:MAG: hypothetical protein WA061_06985 [Microgenomates group bacterium]
MHRERKRPYLDAIHVAASQLVVPKENFEPLRALFGGLAADTDKNISLLPKKSTLTPTEIRQKIISSIKQREIAHIASHPYWQDTPQDPLDIFMTSSHFFDHHNRPLPRTTIPPEKDVKALSDQLLSNEHETVTIPEQFNLALDIARNNVIGALNLLMLTTRMLARGYDQRVYGTTESLETTCKKITKWYAKVPGFKKDSSNGNQIYDFLGDNYYFWTTLYADVSLDRNPRYFESTMIKPLFLIGPPVMYFARKHIAKRPTISEHFEAVNTAHEIANDIRQYFKHTIR